MTADGTLGGYLRVHSRAPAFSGSDGRAYSVSTFVDDDPDPAGRYGAAVLFIRWSAGGEKPDGHLETDYLAFGHSPDAALEPVLALTLQEVKAQLEECIRRDSGLGARDSG